MLNKVFLTAIFTLLVTGCAVTPKYNKLDVKETKVVYSHIPADLLKPCPATRPMSKEEYMTLRPHEREQYLTDYTISLFGNIKDCNTQILKIKEIDESRKE
jgi:ABC-type uncharacterized transport system auxiliary subunit